MFKSGLYSIYWWPLRVDSNLYTLLDLHRGYYTFTDLAGRILLLRPRAATPGLYVGRPESGRIEPNSADAPRVSTNRQNELLGDSAIRRFGNHDS